MHEQLMNPWKLKFTPRKAQGMSPSKHVSAYLKSYLLATKLSIQTSTEGTLLRMSFWLRITETERLMDHSIKSSKKNLPMLSSGIECDPSFGGSDTKSERFWRFLTSKGALNRSFVHSYKSIFLEHVNIPTSRNSPSWWVRWLSSEEAIHRLGGLLSPLEP